MGGLKDSKVDARVMINMTIRDSGREFRNGMNLGLLSYLESNRNLGRVGRSFFRPAIIFLEALCMRKRSKERVLLMANGYPSSSSHSFL